MEKHAAVGLIAATSGHLGLTGERREVLNNDYALLLRLLGQPALAGTETLGTEPLSALREELQEELVVLACDVFISLPMRGLPYTVAVEPIMKLVAQLTELAQVVVTARGPVTEYPLHSSAARSAPEPDHSRLTERPCPDEQTQFEFRRRVAALVALLPWHELPTPLVQVILDQIQANLYGAVESRITAILNRRVPDFCAQVLPSYREIRGHLSDSDESRDAGELQLALSF